MQIYRQAYGLFFVQCQLFLKLIIFNYRVTFLVLGEISRICNLESSALAASLATLAVFFFMLEWFSFAHFTSCFFNLQLRSPSVSVSQGCHNKTPQTGGLLQQKFIVSQSWRLMSKTLVSAGPGCLTSVGEHPSLHFLAYGGLPIIGAVPWLLAAAFQSRSPLWHGILTLVSLSSLLLKTLIPSSYWIRPHPDDLIFI